MSQTDSDGRYRGEIVILLARKAVLAIGLGVVRHEELAEAKVVEGFEIGVVSNGIRENSNGIGGPIAQVPEGSGGGHDHVVFTYRQLRD